MKKDRDNSVHAVLRNRRAMYIQLTYVTLAFLLLVVTAGIFVNEMQMNHLRENAENILSQTELTIISDFHEHETLAVIVSREVHDILVNGGGVSDIRRYIDDSSAMMEFENSGYRFCGIHAYLEEFDAFLPPTDWPNPPVDFDAKSRPWYIAAVEAEGEIVPSPVYVSMRHGGYQISFVRQIFDDDQNPLAVIAVDVELSAMHDLVANTRLTENGYGFLINHDFEIVVHPDSNLLGQTIGDVLTDWDTLFRRIESGGGDIYEYEIDNYLSVTSIVYAKQIENGWYLSVVTPKAEYYSDFYNLVIFLGILAVVLILITNYLLVRLDTARVKSEKAYYEQKSQLDLIEKTREAESQKRTLTNLAHILNELDLLILVTDPATDEILFINDTMRHVFSVDENYAGQQCYKALRGFDERCEFCPCYQLDKNPDKEVIWEQEHTGTKRLFHSFSKYIDWPDGRNVHIQNALDITEMRQAEREQEKLKENLEIALNKAESASKAKSAFLANMSHEIRTPMNAILGITEISLREDDISPVIAERLGKIYDSGNLLLNIINDILDLSKIEANKLEIMSVKYNLPSLINDTVQLNLLRYDEKHIEFILDVNENTPLNLYGDELRLKQIFNNILSNAFKYTEEGEVKMSVWAESGSDDMVTLVVRVSDTGQGMSEEEIGQLFTEYLRFNQEANRTTIGTGLGLSITKNLLDLMNGEIHVESKVSIGSVFTLHIPQKRADSLVCGRDMADKLRSFDYQSIPMSKKSRILREYMPYGSILVVDDVESNIYVTKGMLLPYGLNVDTAASGFEAIEKIEAGNEYDVVLMDHMMPRLDGIETVKRLRDGGYKKPIVALTANALVGQAEKFLLNGFDGYISKPIDSRELNHVLNDYVRNLRPPEVVKEARHVNDFSSPQDTSADAPAHTVNITEIEQYFLMDAESAISSLDKLGFTAGGLVSDDLSLDDVQYDTYEIVVHGMKSALSNIGEDSLREAALNLEIAAKNKHIDVIRNDTPAFLAALAEVSEKLQAKGKSFAGDDDEAGGNELRLGSMDFDDADRDFVTDKLQAALACCRSGDGAAARAAIGELLRKPWPNRLSEVLDDINVLLLHQNLSKAADEISGLIES